MPHLECVLFFAWTGNCWLCKNQKLKLEFQSYSVGSWLTWEIVVLFNSSDTLLAKWLAESRAPVRLFARKHLLQVVAKSGLLDIADIFLTCAWPLQTKVCRWFFSAQKQQHQTHFKVVLLHIAWTMPVYSCASLVSKQWKTHAFDMPLNAARTLSENIWDQWLEPRSIDKGCVICEDLWTTHSVCHFNGMFKR